MTGPDGTDGTDGTTGRPDQPLLRVIRGNPSPEELAALVTVVAALAAPPAPAQVRTVGGWADRTPVPRLPVSPGPGAWRAACRGPGTRTRAAW